MDGVGGGGGGGGAGGLGGGRGAVTRSLAGTKRLMGRKRHLQFVGLSLTRGPSWPPPFPATLVLWAQRHAAKSFPNLVCSLACLAGAGRMVDAVAWQLGFLVGCLVGCP